MDKLLGAEGPLAQVLDKAGKEEIEVLRGALRTMRELFERVEWV